MKHTLIIVLILALLPLSCRHTKKLQVFKTKEKIDIVSNKTSKVELQDSSKTTDFKGIELKKEYRNKNIVVKERTEDVKVEGYSITSKFTIDTTALGDTIRLLSQDDDRSNVSIFYNKKTKQVVAEIKSKDRIVKVPFREIQINSSSQLDRNTTTNKRKESAYLTLNKYDSSTYNMQQNTTKKTSSKDVKKWVMPLWLWATIAALSIVLIAYIYFNRVNILGKLINKIKRYANRF